MADPRRATNGRDPYAISCPECGQPAHAEFVDIGVGEQQCTPYACENEACGWAESYPEFDIPPNDDEGRFE